jgi:hypothetical protein
MGKELKCHILFQTVAERYASGAAGSRRLQAIVRP